jgi:hypothetical protein
MDKSDSDLDVASSPGGRAMPLIALLVAPVLACFVGGIVAAATRPVPASATRPERADNIIPFNPARRGA